MTLPGISKAIIFCTICCLICTGCGQDHARREWLNHAERFTEENDLDAQTQHAPETAQRTPFKETSLDSPADTDEEDPARPMRRSIVGLHERLSRRQKVIAFNAGAVLAIFTFGAIAWDYGSASFSFENEGWFGRDTSYGGADKLGHAWAAYALTSAYTNLYEHFGYDRDRSALYAALSSWSHTALVEVGDGFSGDHGFSWEDLVSNTAGVAFGYLRQVYPPLQDRVDFRLEWIPTPQFRRGDRLDPFTDYSGHKYLLAFKLGGMLQSDHPLLRASEVHVGYYTRGYISGDERYYSSERRVGYVALGLNVTYLLERLTGRKAWNVFDYIQVPYTYIPAIHSFD